MRLLNLRINSFFFFIYYRLFVLILVVFLLFLLHYVLPKFHHWPSSGDKPRPWLLDSAFLSEVAVNHLKKARGEIWPKRSEEETTTKKLPRSGHKVRNR